MSAVLTLSVARAASSFGHAAWASALGVRFDRVRFNRQVMFTMIAVPMVTAFILMPAFTSAGAPQPAEQTGPLDQTFFAMEGYARIWGVKGQEYARMLFVPFATLHLVWVGIESALAGSSDFRGGLGRWGKEALLIGLFWNMIEWGPQLGSASVTWIEEAASSASAAAADGNVAPTPQQLLDNVIELMVKSVASLNPLSDTGSDAAQAGTAGAAPSLTDKVVGWAKQKSLNVANGLVTLAVLKQWPWLMPVILLLFVLCVAAQVSMLLIAQVQTVIATGLGTIVLGCGGAVWTRFMVINYLKVVGTSALKLYVTKFVQGTGLALIQAWILEATAKGTLGIEVLATMLVSTIAMTILTLTAPAMFHQLCSGTASMAGEALANVLPSTALGLGASALGRKVASALSKSSGAGSKGAGEKDGASLTGGGAPTPPGDGGGSDGGGGSGSNVVPLRAGAGAAARSASGGGGSSGGRTAASTSGGASSASGSESGVGNFAASAASGEGGGASHGTSDGGFSESGARVVGSANDPAGRSSQSESGSSSSGMSAALPSSWFAGGGAAGKGTAASPAGRASSSYGGGASSSGGPVIRSGFGGAAASGSRASRSAAVPTSDSGAGGAGASASASGAASSGGGAGGASAGGESTSPSASKSSSGVGAPQASSGPGAGQTAGGGNGSLPSSSRSVGSAVSSSLTSRGSAGAAPVRASSARTEGAVNSAVSASPSSASAGTASSRSESSAPAAGNKDSSSAGAAAAHVPSAKSSSPPPLPPRSSASRASSASRVLAGDANQRSKARG